MLNVTKKKTQRDGTTVEYVKTPVRLVENDRLVASAGRVVPREVYERLTADDPKPEPEAPESEGEDTPDETEEDPFDSQQQAADDVTQYHTGSGWYELPNGERVRGKEAAIKAAAQTEEDK